VAARQGTGHLSMGLDNKYFFLNKLRLFRGCPTGHAKDAGIGTYIDDQTFS